MYVYIFMYIYMYVVCIYMYVYMYIHVCMYVLLAILVASGHSNMIINICNQRIEYIVILHPRHFKLVIRRKLRKKCRRKVRS